MRPICIVIKSEYMYDHVREQLMLNISETTGPLVTVSFYSVQINPILSALQFLGQKV